MLKLNLFVTLGSVLALVLADPAAQKFCDDLKAMENVDLNKMKGPWWEWAGSGTVKYLLPHNCHVSNFYPSADGQSVTTLNNYKHVTKEFIEQQVRYQWKIINGENGGLEMQIITNSRGVQKVPLTILDTDYDKYLLLYMCKEGSSVLDKFRSALLLTRRPTWDETELIEIDTKVEAALVKNGKTREKIGLIHVPFLLKDCRIPGFPDTITSPTPTPDASVGSATEPTSIATTTTGSVAAPTGPATAPAASITATPTDSAATPTSNAATPTGSAAAPAGIAAKLTVSAAVPTSNAATPTGSAAAPAGITAKLTVSAAVPTSNAATPTGSNVETTGSAITPTRQATDTTLPNIVADYNGVRSLLPQLPAGFGRVPSRPKPYAPRKITWSLGNVPIRNK